MLEEQGVRIVSWHRDTPPSEEEAEARLSQEGYTAFRWHDVPGAAYPKHRHEKDECIWILKGEIIFTVNDQEFHLRAGDRLYLPSTKSHSAKVPDNLSVTYLVGRKNT